jgi:diketogulonate reductase-like aldo/keto reductase
MEYRNLGRTGLKVSALSYGAWVSFGNQLDVKDAKVLLSRCREAGVNFFDNAEVYANGRAEEIMGSAIRELGWKRSDVVISTKLFWGGQGPNDKGLSRKHIIEGIKVWVLSLSLCSAVYVLGLFVACLSSLQHCFVADLVCKFWSLLSAQELEKEKCQARLSLN